MNKYSSWRYKAWYIIVIGSICILPIIFYLKKHILENNLNDVVKGVIIRVDKKEYVSQDIDGGVVATNYLVVVKFTIDSLNYFNSSTLKYPPKNNDSVFVRYNKKDPNISKVNF